MGNKGAGLYSLAATLDMNCTGFIELRRPPQRRRQYQCFFLQLQSLEVRWKCKYFSINLAQTPIEALFDVILQFYCAELNITNYILSNPLSFGYAGKSRISTGTIIAIVAPIVVSVLLFAIGCYFLVRKSRKKFSPTQEDRGGKNLQVQFYWKGLSSSFIGYFIWLCRWG